MTHNQYIKLFTDIATNHNDIKSFGNGPIHEYTDRETTFKYGQSLWVEAGKVNIAGGVKKTSYTFYVADQVNKDNQSNRNEVISDTKRTSEDVISVLNNSAYYDYFEIEKSINLEDFYEQKFDNEFCGWSFAITFNEDFDYNACQANITSIPTIIGTNN